MPRPIDGDLRTYLEALRAMLEQEAGKGWPVLHAITSIEAVLKLGSNPPGGATFAIQREIDYLLDRLAEVRKARQESSAPAAPAGERQVVVAYQITHGRRGDGWWYVLEVPGQPREDHGPFDSEEEAIDAKVEMMRYLEGERYEHPDD